MLAFPFRDTPLLRDRMPQTSPDGPRPFSFQPPQGEIAILSGACNPQFAQRVAEHVGCPVVPGETQVFSEGNVFVRILENVRGRDAFIVQGVSHPVNDSFVELLFWIDALKRASAQQVTAVIPFFGYAKGDKKDEPRVSIRARVCADAIEAAGADRVLTMDLHTPQIQGFFRIPVDHLYARNALCEHLASLEIPDLVVCSPDTGFAKEAAAYARLLDVPVAIGNKNREGHTETSRVLEVIGDVADRNVVIVDDFTISGGSLVNMAAVLKQRGARTVYAAVSHGVFAQGAAERIEQSCIERLFVTDTVERFPGRMPANAAVVSVAGLFARAIRSIHERTSISMLFS